ncbi:hypothetical protein D3C78_1225590 [compost metagenome]
MLSFIDSRCFSNATTRPWSSLRVYGRRQACEQSPRLALRPVWAWEILHWPEKATHSAPWMKNSMAASVSAAMARICCRFSSRASTSWEKPAWSRNLARSRVRMSVWVLACSSIGGMSSSITPRSCTISASTPASYS